MFQTVSMIALVATLLGVAVHWVLTPAGGPRCPLRGTVYVLSLLLVEQKSSPLGVLKKLVYLLAVACFLVLSVTGFYPLLVRGEHISGYFMMIHATFAPIFALCLAILPVGLPAASPHDPAARSRGGQAGAVVAAGLQGGLLAAAVAVAAADPVHRGQHVPPARHGLAEHNPGGPSMDGPDLCPRGDHSYILSDTAAHGAPSVDAHPVSPAWCGWGWSQQTNALRRADHE
jgi:hypothetical protein